LVNFPFESNEFLPAKRFDTILLAFKFLGITFSLLMLYVIFTDKTHSLLAWIFVCYSVGGVIFINFSSAQSIVKNYRIFLKEKYLAFKAPNSIGKPDDAVMILPEGLQLAYSEILSASKSEMVRGYAGVLRPSFVMASDYFDIHIYSIIRDEELFLDSVNHKASESKGQDYAIA